MNDQLFCEDCGQRIYADAEEGDEPSVCPDCAREWARIDMEIDRRREEPDRRDYSFGGEYD